MSFVHNVVDADKLESAGVKVMAGMVEVSIVTSNDAVSVSVVVLTTAVTVPVAGSAYAVTGARPRKSENAPPRAIVRMRARMCAAEEVALVNDMLRLS